VCNGGGGGRRDRVVWRASTGVIHCVFDQIPNLQNCFFTPNKKPKKFIWAPVNSCTHWLRPRNSLPSPAFRLIYEGAIGPPRETTYLCKTPDFRTRSTEQKDRVKEEIGIMRRLANPNVIKFIDAFENSREIILGKSLLVLLL
jgi:hypothetical protein